MNLSKLLDIIGKNLSRIKTAGILILLVVFFISMAQHGCNKAEMEDMVERVTGLNIQNDLLLKDVKDRDSLLLAKEDSIKDLKNLVAAASVEHGKLIKDNKRIKRKYDELAEELLQISSDSSYRFLNEVAYPFGGEKMYPFSEPQVKGIHKTYLEVDGLIALNDNLRAQNDNLQVQVDLQEDLVIVAEESMELLKSNEEDLKEVIENKDEITEVEEKQEKKQKRRDVLKKIGIGTLLLLIGFAAGAS